jgi:REP element-mobilizing transposase RayT
LGFGKGEHVARPCPIAIDGAIYHVTFRGNEQKSIFKSDADRQRLLDAMAQARDFYQTRIFLICPMPNHVHAVMETPRGNLDRLPKEISRMVELRRVRARRARGRVPAEVSDRAWNEAPALLGSISLRQGPFDLGLRWLGRYSPFQGCSGLAALSQAKIPPAIRKLILATGLSDCMRHLLTAYTVYFNRRHRCVGYSR